MKKVSSRIVVFACVENRRTAGRPSGHAARPAAFRHEVFRALEHDAAVGDGKDALELVRDDDDVIPKLGRGRGSGRRVPPTSPGRGRPRLSRDQCGSSEGAGDRGPVLIPRQFAGALARRARPTSERTGEASFGPTKLRELVEGTEFSWTVREPKRRRSVHDAEERGAGPPSPRPRRCRGRRSGSGRRKAVQAIIVSSACSFRTPTAETTKTSPRRLEAHIRHHDPVPYRS